VESGRCKGKRERKPPPSLPERGGERRDTRDGTPSSEGERLELLSHDVVLYSITDDNHPASLRRMPSMALKADSYFIFLTILTIDVSFVLL
jgi:hypothetical protein